MESHLPREKALLRRQELFLAFERMVDYAERNGVRAILLCGDVFDLDAPLKKHKDNFYSAVRNHPDIDFLYLRGNHDTLTSYTEEDLPNLRTFDSDMTSYIYENVRISGIELSAANANSLYSSLRADRNYLNIAMLHGQIGDSVGEGKIHLGKLTDAGFDYLALGHVHAYARGKIGDGVWCYPGCPEGRGFDEPGEHGFVLLDISDRITDTFIPNARRKIEEIDADISDAADAYSAYRIVKSLLPDNRENIYRINLVGSPVLDTVNLDREIASYFDDYFFVDVKDRTVRALPRTGSDAPFCLQNEFIRLVNDSADFSVDEKQRIIRVGLRALAERSPEE